jgi:response regulator RpfG family c-di-GMP phosphodiesterase
MQKLVEQPGRTGDRETVDSRGVATGSASRTSRPALVVVDDDRDDLERVTGGLIKRHGEDYRIVCEVSAERGLKRLRELEASGEDVALVLADQWMPGASGMEFLARVHHVFPTAKRALLISQGTAPSGSPSSRRRR